MLQQASSLRPWRWAVWRAAAVFRSKRPWLFLFSPHDAYLTVDVGGGLMTDRSGSSSRFLGEAGGEGRGDDVEETGFPLRRPPKEVIVQR